MKWSPDGSCLVTASDDTTIRFFDLPPDAMDRPALSCSLQYDDDDPQCSAAVQQEHALVQHAQDSISPALEIRTGECVYDYTWFPRMSALDPMTCLVASSSRGQPCHVWDAIHGDLIATFRSYDQVDEVESAFSVAFSPDGSRLVTGHDKYIRIFDTQRPGREYLATIHTQNVRQQLYHTHLRFFSDVHFPNRVP